MSSENRPRSQSNGLKGNAFTPGKSGRDYTIESSRLASQVGEFIRHAELLQPDDRLLVAVSGGPDSLCLLYVLRELAYGMHVAHLNHSLRPEADSEAEFVAQVAQGLGLPVTVEKASAKEYAAQHHLSVEEAARVLRYRFLARVAAHESCSAVAVGHTADDQVETVLMHLLRGSGLAGLRGMQPRVRLADLLLAMQPEPRAILVRPLLRVTRHQTEAYCAANGLQPRLDRSNLDTTYFRNSLRYELLPRLERYNPRIRQVIQRTADVLAADYEVVQTAGGHAWDEVVQPSASEEVAWHRSAFLRQPIAIRRGLVRRGIGRLRAELRDVDFETVERALAFAQHPSRGRVVELLANLVIQVDGDRLVLRDRRAGLDTSLWPQAMEAIDVSVPSVSALEAGWTLVAMEPTSAVDLLERARGNDDPWLAFFDADSLRARLQLRPRRAGDRIRPLGMGGHSVKVSDVMIDRKVPVQARASWPVLVAGEDVLWLPGLRQAEAGKVTADTRRLLAIRMEASHATLVQTQT